MEKAGRSMREIWRVWFTFALAVISLVCSMSAHALRIGFSEASTQGANAATITVARPANVRAGDVLIAVVTARNAPTISATTSGQWDVRGDQANGTALRAVVFTRTVGAIGSEPASYSFTLGSSQRVAAAIIAYRGALVSASSLPVVATSASASNSANVVAPSVIPAIANSMLLTFHATAADTTFTVAGTMIERAEQSSGGSASLAFAEEFLGTSTLATGTRTAVAGNSAANVGISIALRPDTTVPTPVAEYRLDETSWNGTAGEVVNSSGGGLNGTALGGAQTTTTNAYLCRSGSFDGANRRIDVADDPKLDIYSTLTVTAWIRPNSIPTSDLMSYMSKDNNYEAHVATNGRINWWWNGGGGGTRDLFTPANTIVTNTWQFVALVFSRGTQTIYIGTTGATATAYNVGTDNAQLTPDASKFQIGDDQDLGGRRFNGLIDEVRIYDVALTASEVEQVRTATRVCPQIVTGFQITVPATASTCTRNDVTIRAVDAANNTVVGYAGLVNIQARSSAPVTGRGDWSSSVAAEALRLNNGTANDGDATYQFSAGAGGDNGDVTLQLSNQNADNMTITVTDSTNAAITTTSSVMSFRNNAFVITATDATISTTELGDTSRTMAVAGRPHGMTATLWRRETTGSLPGCSVATNYTGNRTLKAWYSPDVDHPSGATAPSINGGSALPIAVPGISNLTLNFTIGVATFNLTTADVGKYSLNLRDDTRTFASGIDIDSTSPTMTVRPFGLAITNVVKGAIANPEGTATSGSRFIVAADTFSATVGAYLWAAADDVNNDGLPDTGANIVNNGLTPRFAWPTTLNVASTASVFSPVGGNLGALSGTTSLIAANFSGGAATVTDLRYSEVGSVQLTARALDYLNTSVIDFDNARIGVNVNSVTGLTVPVGRFYPNSFALTASGITASCAGSGFTYMDEPALGINFALEARNLNNLITTNYRSTVYNVGTVGVVAENADSGTNLSSRLSFSVSPTPTWNNGVYSVAASNGVFSRNTAPDGPYDNLVIGVQVTDPDSVVVASRDMNPTTAGACGTNCTARALNSATPTRMRFGRLRLSNATGAPALALPISMTTEYWDSSLGGFVTNALDNCTRLTANQITFGNYSAPLAACNTSGTPTTTNGITFSGGRAVTSPAASVFKLTAPNVRGSVDLTVNLGATATGNTCTGGTASAAQPAAKPWLQGNWGASSFDRNPTSRAAFGVYGNSPDIIYLRERY